MRTRAPIVSIDGPTLTIRTELVASDGSELPALEVCLPRAAADLLDPTATPTLAVLAALAAARGETLQVEGSTDAVAAAAATRLAGQLAQRWNTGAAALDVESRPAAPNPPPAGIGLLFDRGVDAWAALLAADDAITHLVLVGREGPLSPIDAEIRAGHRAVAAERGLAVVELTTTAPLVLATLGAPAEAEVMARVSAALVAGAGLRRLVVPDALDAHLVVDLATGTTDVVAGAPDRSPIERVALIRSDPHARATVRPCADDTTAGNCGRCVPCLLVQSAFTLTGDPDPSRGFTTSLALAAVRFAPLEDTHEELVSALVAGLPPGHEALRRAWADAWEESQGRDTRYRWGLDGPPGLAGPDLAQRVAAALRATTGGPDAPMPSPLGWRSGTVPLRPALADHDAIWAAAALGPQRPRAWAVVEPHVRDGRRDGEQARLAWRAQEALGSGVAYLPGVLWADDQAPVLGPEAVGRLLDTARSRLWWREDGDLDPLRVVEAVEHGCLPLQVMPDGPAVELALALPPMLAPLVVAESDLVDLDLSPTAVAARFGPALEHLLGGSIERDLLARTTGG